MNDSMINLRKHTSLFLYYSPYLIYFVVLFMYHKWANINTGDDVFFAQVLDSQTAFSFLNDRYNSWSSRIVIELVLIYVAHYSQIFKFVDIIINMSVLHSTFVLCNLRNIRSRLFVLSLFMMYNLRDMRSAGWVATMVNYMWVIAALCIFAIILRRIAEKKTIHIYQYLLFVPLLLFAGSHEQSVLILVSELLVCLFVMKTKYNIISKPLILSLLSCAVMLIVILLCPGNANRMQKAIEICYPEIVNQNAAEKAILGLIRFHSLFIRNLSHIFVSFGVIIFLHSLTQTQRPYRRLKVFIASVPLLVTIAYLLVYIFNSSLGALFPSPFEPRGIDYSQFIFYPPVLTSLLVLLSITIYIFLSFNKSIFVAYILLFGACVASQVMLGFSPTLYASGARTSVFLYFAFVFLTGLLFNDIKCKKAGTLYYITISIVATTLIVGIIDEIAHFQLMLTVG